MQKQIKISLGLILIVFAVVAFFLIANKFGGGEKVESEKPRVICKTQNECFWTAHIHATVAVFKDGKELDLSFEQGELEGDHTHSEKDKIHWHGLIPVPKGLKEPTDLSEFKLSKVVEDLELGGVEKFVVNGREVDENYTWKDGDAIEIYLKQ